MARYIDADALIEMCERQIECEWNTIAAPGSWSHAFQDFSDLVEQTPTADVAPKREVARLEAELAEWHKLTQKSVSGYIRYCEREAVKNFTEEFEEDCLDFPMKETDIHLIVDNEKYAELKKKYTEEKE